MTSDPLRAQLDRLLSQSPSQAAASGLHQFDQLTAPVSDRIVLFGAGGLGRHTLAGLRSLGITPIAIADNNTSNHGKTIDGIPILSPAVAASLHASSAAFVVAIWNEKCSHAQVFQQLRDLGCRTITSFAALFRKYPDTFLPYLRLDRPERVLLDAHPIRQAFDLLSDDLSCENFLAHLRWHLGLTFLDLPPVSSEPQYLPKGVFTWQPDEVFVDVGAFDGDTLRSILAIPGTRFKNFLALEPDPTSYAKLQTTCASAPEPLRQRITTLPYGAANDNKTVSFNANGGPGAAINATGATKIEIRKLDDLLQNESPTYIKMDIEGAEPQALLGASATIQKHRPILAVCLYHQQNHLWQLPLLINRLAPGYRFYLRQHNPDGWDLVAYAVPPSRLPAPPPRHPRPRTQDSEL